MKRKGFTLIELLIVISIVAILTMFLFPVFMRVRENARRASCASNLKQIALGLHMYTQDYDERAYAMAPDEYGGGGITNQLDWLRPYDDYLKSSQIKQCPSAPKNVRPVSYSTSFGAFRSFSVTGGTPGQSIPYQQICDNSRTMFALDGEGDYTITVPSFTSQRSDLDGTKPCTVSDCMTVAAGSGGGTAGAYRVSMRHLAGFNAAFFDGHVKWYPRTRLFQKWDGTAFIPGDNYVYDGRPVATTGTPASLKAYYAPGMLWFTGL